MKFEKLKEDFKYNLRLVSERDAELDQYDVIVSRECTRTTDKDITRTLTHHNRMIACKYVEFVLFNGHAL